VKLLLNRLFTNNTMSFLSLDGRSYGKMAFRDTPICQFVVDKHLVEFFLKLAKVCETALLIDALKKLSIMLKLSLVLQLLLYI